MNIKIIQDKTPHLDKITGGGYAVTDVEIHIAANMPLATKQEVVIHEVLEVALKFVVCHDKIDELTSLICKGLSKL